MTDSYLNRKPKRKYDRQHKRIRKALLASHVQGTPCFWCAKPMFREPELNWDERPLAADHVKAGGARRGEAATRLLHYTCNSQRGDGSKDHARPALALKAKSAGSGSGWQW